MFSKTHDSVEGNDVRVIKTNLSQGIQKLKEQPGKDMLLGGSHIATTFMELDLIHEYWLYIHPVVLGDGTSVFRSLDDRISLQLIQTISFDAGVVHLRSQKIN